MDPVVLEALGVTLRVALGATLLVLVPAVSLAWLLARRDFRGKALVETLIALPLVLPPTAVGYLLLRLLAQDGPLSTLGLELLLTWKGAVLAAAIMSLPLVVRTARVAFESVDPRLESMGRSLGLGRVAVFRRISLPLARRGVVAGLFLGFGRAIGEFGATVIVAGNIPGETQTLALAIFNDIQLGRDERALSLVGLTALMAFVIVWIVERLLRKRGEPAR